MAGRYGAAGLEMGIAVLIGYLVGSWLDRRLGTSPWMTILWITLGFGAAVKAIVDLVRRAKKDGVA